MDGSPSDPTRPKRRRPVIWLRRIGVGILATVVAVTAFSLVFNRATEPPKLLDPGFGDYVTVGTSEVHYQRWGDRGSSIVLVPGAMESSIVWAAVGPILGERHRVYALDMPWHGYTRYTGSMGLADQAALLAGFVTALDLQRPLLVGHSLGAAVTATVALRHPDDVGGVVFADGDALPIPFGPRGLGELLVRLPYTTSVLRLGERQTSLVRGIITSGCGSDCAAVTPELVQQWVRPLHQQSEENALRRFRDDAGYGLTDEQIASITAPTEIIWGSDDRAGGSLAATIANLHHPPVHIIENAGHLTMLADPAAFARAVEAAPTTR